MKERREEREASKQKKVICLKESMIVKKMNHFKRWRVPKIQMIKKMVLMKTWS